MRMMGSALVAGIVAASLFLAHAAPSEAQPPQRRPGMPPADPAGQPGIRRPARDLRQPPAEGTATIRGRVVDGLTGMPIARAKVRTGNRDPRTARTANTDTEGVFTLTRVPAGQVMLAAEKAAYLPGTYPERQRTMRAVNVTISDGQTLDNITIPMYRGGAITGRVVDAYGDPVEHAMVNVFSVPPVSRAGSLGRGGARASQSTNDIGEYRIGRLEPGQYYVMIAPQSRRANNEEDAGSVPGRTWYPGVASFDQAQTVALERGGSAAADIQMLETTLTKVSGVVLTGKGTPAKNGHLSARGTGGGKGMPPSLGQGWSESGSAQLDQYGNFDLVLPPGEYILEANVPQNEEAMKQGGRYEMDRGQARISVGGESMSGLTIATGTGGTASGRIVFKGTSAAPTTNLAGFNVNFQGPESLMNDCRAFDRATVNADGTFSIANLWGSCQIRAYGGVSRGWVFEAVMHNGNNITNRVIEFGLGSSISGLEIVFSDRIGNITVTLSDAGAQPQDFVAIAFPADKEKWGDSRYLYALSVVAPNPAAGTGAPGAAAAMGRTAMGPDTTPYAIGVMPGSNSFRNLLAGDYFVVALEDASYEDAREPEYLERLSQIATRVTLSAGESQSVQLRRQKAPE